MAPNLKICSIIHDNFAAQSNAVDTVIEEREEIILDVPCFNHAVNLVFVNSMSHSEDLKSLVDLVLSFQQLFKLAGICVPSVPKTRWLYVVELIDFVLTRSESLIIAFVAANEEVDLEVLNCPLEEALDNLILLQSILKPLHTFSKRVEEDTARLCHVIPLAFSCIAEWQQAAADELRHNDFFLAILHVVTTHFFARLKSNAFEEAVTAFLFSCDGRSWWMEQQGHETVDWTDLFELEEEEEEEEALDESDPEEERPQETSLTTNERPAAEPCSDASRTVDVITAFVTNETLEEQAPPDHDDREVHEGTITQRRRAAYNALLEEYMEMPVLFQLEAPLFEAPLVLVRRALQRYCSELDPAIEMFAAWLTPSLNSVVEEWGHILGGVKNVPMDRAIWLEAHAFATGDESWESWVPFTRCACVFVSAGCSEAAVERLLSKQKTIQSTCMTNIAMETLTAKLGTYGPDFCFPEELYEPDQ